MQKLWTLSSVVVIAVAISFASTRADATDACRTTEFKTELVKNACKQGGQKAAKDVMKKWNKEKKIKSCNQCHTKLAPSYELKADGLAQYKKLGGK